MKKIYYIAKNELYSLFFSPIAWILMILFMILTASDYIRVSENFLGLFERGGPNLAMIKNLTFTLTGHPMYGFLSGVVRNLYMFFPLITMGLISREASSGTIRLLYSSPVRIREIVLGKYLAILAFTACLVALLSLTLIGVCLSINNPDYGQMLASVLGICMVLFTYASIGLFISSLTSYQIVAAIVTIAIFALLSQIGDLWQDIDIVRGIAYYMNISGKSRNLIGGLFNLRDVCYFGILIASFLAFTMIRLRTVTKPVRRVLVTAHYAAVIAAAFLIGFISSIPKLNVYFDTTRNKLHTITPPTQAILGKLKDDELVIDVYANLLNGYFGYFTPSQQNDLVTGVWEQFIRFKRDVRINFIYYYKTDSNSYYIRSNPGKSLKQIALQQAKAYNVGFDRFVTPHEIGKKVDIDAEEGRCFFQLTYKGRSAIVRTFDDAAFWPSENEIAAAINRLVAEPPKVSFVCDDIERGPYSLRNRDYNDIAHKLGNRYSLINQGYDFDTLSLLRNDIPQNLSVLVLADPRMPIASGSLAKIDAYLNGGGNLLIAAEPDRKEITRPVLDKLGISVLDGMIIQPNEKYGSDVAFPYLTAEGQHLSPQFAKFLSEQKRYYGDSLFRVAMAGAGALSYVAKDGFTITPLLYTDAGSSWNRKAPISNDSLQLRVRRREADSSARFVTAVKLNRNINGREQRIIVTSDADLLSHDQVYGRDPIRYNYDFGFWCFSHFTYGRFPADTMRPDDADNAFTVSNAAIGFQKTIFYWIIPALLGIAGAILLIRRKRK